jgi:hypothetical protein
MQTRDKLIGNIKYRVVQEERSIFWDVDNIGDCEKKS